MAGIHEQAYYLPSPFVGREGELALFRNLARKVAQDGRHLLLVSGPPGIGKSRLLEELYKTAKGLDIDGVKPLVGMYRFREETSVPEEAIWERVLDSFHSRGGAEKSAEPPTDGERIPTPVEQFRVLCRRGPVILFLDNLHFGAEGFLLRFIEMLEELSDFPFLAVGAYQELPVYRKRFLTFLSDAVHISRTVEHSLGCLSEKETALLMESIIGEKAGPWLIDRAVEQTGGNPLFIQEIARIIAQYRHKYDDVKQLWRCEVPKAAHKTIGRRLSTISPGCLGQLQVLALTGESFFEDEIEIVCLDTLQDTWRTCVQEAIDYGFLYKDDVEGKYRFYHHILREAVTASIPETEVALMARQAAIKLEEAGLGEKEDWALRLAGLWSRVSAREAENGYRRYIRKAIKAALKHGEYELAADLSEKIIDPAMKTIRTKEEAELLYDYAEAKSYAGYRSEAVGYFVKSFRYYQEHGDINGMVRIASRTEYIRTGESGSIDYYEDIFKILPSQSVEWVKLMYQYAFYLINKIGNFEQIEGILQKADSMKIGTEDPERKLYSAIAHSCFALVSRCYDKALQNTVCGLKENGESNPFCTMVLMSIQFMCLSALGKFEEAVSEIPKFLQVASQLKDGYALVYAYYHSGRLKVASGKWKEAKDFFDTGAAYYPYNAELLAWRVCMEYMLGNIDPGDLYRRRLLRIREQTPEGPYKPFIYSAYTAAVRNLCTGMDGDIADWVSVLRSIAADTSAHPFILIRAHLCLLLSGTILKNTRLIKNAISVLEKPNRYRLIRPYKIQWALGLGKLQLRRTEEAIVHFDKALRSARWYGDRPMEACILYDLGRAKVIADNERADRKQTVDMLKAARDLSCNLGMVPLTERIGEFTSTYGLFESNGSGLLCPLTKREMEVAACLERGLTNKEISEKISISVHTVVNHIRHIMEKTGTANRGAAVAALKRAATLDGSKV